jgi:hypothetical protein
MPQQQLILLNGYTLIRGHSYVIVSTRYKPAIQGNSYLPATIIMLGA